MAISTSLNTGSHCFHAVDSPFSDRDPGRAAASRYISILNKANDFARLEGITQCCHRPLDPLRCYGRVDSKVGDGLTGVGHTWQ